MAIRLKDIADDLGVSLVTVSKVLRNKADVSEQTRKRILQRVKELNYRPNMLARGLASGKSYNIGLIVPDLGESFFADFAKGLSAELRKHSYRLILASAEEEPELEREEIDNLLARGVDALLISSCQNTAAGFQAIANSKTPYVLFDRALPGLAAHFVGTDDLSVGFMATEHLIKGGRRRIAYIGSELSSTSVDRLTGYRNALADRRIPFREELVTIRTRLEESGHKIGNQAMDNLLKGRKLPDAVFCYNDLTAVGAIRSLLTHGLQVPEDVAVIGCGNLRLSSYLEVPLSSIDQSILQQGEQAAKLALSLIAGKHKRGAKELRTEPQLVVRASSAAKRR